MRGGSPSPIARPKRTMSAGLAPTTCAMRSGVTNGQLRHTKAWRRLGKCGNGTGLGAAPLGRSATAIIGDFASPFASAGHPNPPSASPPAAAELVLRKVRREKSFDRSFMAACSALDFCFNVLPVDAALSIKLAPRQHRGPQFQPAGRIHFQHPQSRSPH